MSRRSEIGSPEALSVGDSRRDAALAGCRSRRTAYSRTCAVPTSSLSGCGSRMNARHVKNLPGRKTDVSDAAWLAQLGAHGLVRGSFVPPEPIRQLRDLTRTRMTITRERAREIQRLEKLLEDAGIKLSSVASDISGVSGRLMLEALIAGQRDPAELAELAKRRLRSKIPELTEALTGRFGEHHSPERQRVERDATAEGSCPSALGSSRALMAVPRAVDVLDRST